MRTYWLSLFIGAAVAQLLAAEQPGAKLQLKQSPPLVEPAFPKAGHRAAAERNEVRPAILELRPAADPIYFDESREHDANGEWRTYRVPKVDAVSRDGDGVALGGYDAVAYLGGRAERGSRRFETTLDGLRWQFVSEENRGLFLRNPARYIPEFGGFCTYSVGKGFPAQANPRVFVLEGGSVYLFFDEAARAAWEQDRAAMLNRAAKNWPRLHR
ncbi:MAG: YHS domain-containing (seleno)protein [Bryobacteraceae bacterium]